MPRSSNHRRADFATFDALDCLPAPLLREVCFAARVWDAVILLRLYEETKVKSGHDYAVDWLGASIRHGDEQDVLDFSFRHQLKYKYPLPCLAADATILRFQEARSMRRYGLPKSARRGVRAAWRASERLMPR